jgi:DNA (cytosine-5)-methyltransferase 1
MVTMNKFFSLSESAKLLSVSEDTIRRWEKKGLIKSSRNNSNHRLFNIEELSRVSNKANSTQSGVFRTLKSKKNGFTVIELFAGCGGMALGLENAGFKTELLVEIDKSAVNTLKTNRRKWNIVCEDVSKVNFSSFYGKVDVVAGGFPCQAFSYAGKGLGFGDPRGTLFYEFLRCIKEVKPKVVVGENVRGLEKHDSGKTLKTMIHLLDEAGYDVAYRVLRAQFLDVPQKRERIVILGVKKDCDLAHVFPKEKDYTVNLKEALKNVPKSAGYEYSDRKYKIMKLIPQGGYWRDLPEKLQREYMGGSYHLGGGKTGMARRLSLMEPSLTLTCNPAQKQTERCHPIETRPLNVREYARIQTFPDDWAITGSVCSAYRQIGNAVPVNLAFHIGKAVESILSKKFNPDTQILSNSGNLDPEIQLEMDL